MIGHLAAYDPALATPTGDYWVWRSAAVDKTVLERFYAEIHRSHAPSEPNQLGAAGDLHGGCLARGDWAAFYRYFDGGRDRRGRPGRFVLLLCLVPRGAIVGADCSGWFDEGPLTLQNEIDVAAGASPAPPDALDPDMKFRPLNPIELSSVNDELGATILRGRWNYCAVLPTETEFHWKFTRKAGDVMAELDRFERALPSRSTPAREGISTPTIRHVGEATLRASTLSSPVARSSRSWRVLVGIAAILAIAIGGGAFIQHRFHQPFGFRERVDIEHLRTRFTERQVPTNGIVSFTKQEVDELFAEIHSNGLAQQSNLNGDHEYGGTKAHVEAERTGPLRDPSSETWRWRPEQPRGRNDEKTP